MDLLETLDDVPALIILTYLDLHDIRVLNRMYSGTVLHRVIWSNLLWKRKLDILGVKVYNNSTDLMRIYVEWISIRGICHYVKYNDYEMVKVLIDNGVNGISQYNDTIRIAVRWKNLELLKLLLDIDNTDPHISAVKYAARYSNHDTVKLLIETEIRIQFNNMYSIKWAAFHGYTELVRELISAGADVTVGEDYALRHACRKGFIEIVKLLIDAGANIQAKNNLALRWSTRSDIVDLLVGLGADIKI